MPRAATLKAHTVADVAWRAKLAEARDASFRSLCVEVKEPHAYAAEHLFSCQMPKTAISGYDDLLTIWYFGSHHGSTLEMNYARRS
jgi:hypothetical protein